MKFYDPSISRIENNGQKLSLFSLASPIFLQHISIGLLGTINTILLSGYSSEAVGAVGVANQVATFLTSFTSLTLHGMRIILGVEFGRNNKKGAASVAGTAMWTAFVSCLFLGTLICILADPILTLMNLEGNAKVIATSYLKIVAIFTFIPVAGGVFGTSLSCLGYTKLIAISSVATHTLNAVLGYIVLYGNIDFPFSGTDGLAIRSVISNLIGISITGTGFIIHKCPFSFKYNFNNMKRIIRIGLPSSMSSFAYTAGQTITTSIIASFGINVVNAKIHVSTITGYVYYFSLAISHASAIIMGRLRGMEEYAKSKRLFWQNLRLSCLLNCIASICLFLARKPLLGLFTDDPEIIALAGTIMIIDIFVETIRGATNVGDQSLNANGDVKTVSLVSISACWVVTVLFSYLLGVKLGLGLVGCWIAFFLDELFKSSLYIIRWRSGKWIGRRI